ncbi:hypothetical protein N0V82_006444 [Gnomoniopsis sp. IMI 355080]|nr:hypothetical protein N0V82_006444 [Gnomoniopsis sp. IMI 355080]
MHRLALNLTRRAPRTLALPTGLTTTRATNTSLSLRTYATSAPKEAEEASAQSGGSRSKDAVENKSAWNSTEAKGRTGGGDSLEASENPPPRPKIHNASVPGAGRNKLTKEQQEEVDRHNADFEKKHDRASAAEDDKVNKHFWKGQGGHAKEDA